MQVSTVSITFAENELTLAEEYEQSFLEMRIAWDCGVG
jgi:hypothetical protein